MLTRNEYYKILIFFLIVITILIIQYLISDTLNIISIPIIKTLQADPYTVDSMLYVSDLGSKAIKNYLLIVVFSICNTYHSFIYTVVCYSSILVCSWLKILLQEPRPYWLDDGVKAYDCESGYGYPSNHVMTSVPSFLMFFEIMYYHYEIDKTVNANIFYWIGIILNILICSSIGFSRMTLGVHSLDQVFFGLLAGFATYYFFLHIIDFDLKDFHPFLQNISNRFNKAKNFFIYIGFYLAFIVSTLLIRINYDPSWTQRMIKNCGIPPMTPFYQCLYDSADYFTLFGALVGIMYDVKFHYNSSDKLPLEYIYENLTDNFLSQPRNENRIGKWNDTSSQCSFIRCLMFILLNKCIFHFCFFLLGYYDKNILTIFVFGRALPSAISTFILYGFGKKISYYLGLSNVTKNEEEKNK